MRTVAGLFGTLVQTRKVIEELSAAGFNAENVSVISTGSTPEGVERREGAEGPDDTVDKNRFHPGVNATTEPRDNVPAPMLGAASAAGFGSAYSSPEQSYPTAGGKTGVGTVGLHKSLVGWGFSNSDIRDYETAIAEGQSLLAVEVVDNDTVPRATDIFERYGAFHVVVANPFAHNR